MATDIDNDPTSDQDFESEDGRLEVLEALDLHMAAIERFLSSRELRVPEMDDHFEMRVAEQLSEEIFRSLVYQYKYAGRQTINYFIIKGISDHDLSEIASEVESRLPAQENVQSVSREPFIAECEVIGDRLYLPVGYYEYAGSEHPITGTNKGILITKRVVVVISDDTDLVEIRGSDVNMVEDIRDEICKSIGKFKDSVKDRPNFGVEFQEEFNELVEKYFNLKVRVDDQEDTTLDTISFTSKEDEEGDRRDARDSDRVEKELSEKGSEITMGYVELNEGFRFRMNRESAKVSFMKSEKEENLNKITEIIDNVLRETGEYTQGQISGLEDVPE